MSHEQRRNEFMNRDRTELLVLIGRLTNHADRFAKGLGALSDSAIAGMLVNPALENVSEEKLNFSVLEDPSGDVFKEVGIQKMYEENLRVLRARAERAKAKKK